MGLYWAVGTKKNSNIDLRHAHDEDSFCPEVPAFIWECHLEISYLSAFTHQRTNEYSTVRG